jgi:hypothetical protein
MVLLYGPAQPAATRRHQTFATFFFNLYFLKRNNRVLTSNVHVVRLNAVNADTSTEILKTTPYLLEQEKRTNFFSNQLTVLIFLSYASGTGVIESVPQGRVPQKIREK